jgi:hypothetical protein
VAKASGIKKAGFGKTTSPAVRVMKSALQWLKVNATEEAIVEAMRKPRERVGK